MSEEKNTTTVTVDIGNLKQLKNIANQLGVQDGQRYSMNDVVSKLIKEHQESGETNGDL